MFRGVYDFLSGGGGPGSQEGVGPSYTITRMIGAPPPAPLPGVVRHTYEVSRADDYIHFRAAVLLELLGNPVVQRRLETILRDYLRHSTIRERYVVVRIGDWLGEFTVVTNTADRGTLLLEAGDGQMRLERIP